MKTFRPVLTVSGKGFPNYLGCVLFGAIACNEPQMGRRRSRDHAGRPPPPKRQRPLCEWGVTHGCERSGERLGTSVMLALAYGANLSAGNRRFRGKRGMALVYNEDSCARWR